MNGDAPAAALERLTERERVVLGLCLEGLSVKLIAWRLQCAQSTVSTHKTNVMRKLEVFSDVELGRVFGGCYQCQVSPNTEQAA